MSYRTLHVTLSNLGGVLETKVISGHSHEDFEAATTQAVMDLINEVGYLRPGDTISIIEPEDD